MSGRGHRQLEQRVIALAISFCRTYSTTPGYGAPIARAAGYLNNAVEQLLAARSVKPTPPTPSGEQR